MLYAILRHLELGGKKYLYLLAASLLLHFTAKETAFIYTAEALLYLAVYFIARVTRRSWEDHELAYRGFIIALSATILCSTALAGYALYTRNEATLSGTETAIPSDPNAPSLALVPPGPEIDLLTAILGAAASIGFIAAAYFLVRGYSWERIRSERSFELLMVCGTIVLPMLSALPIKLLEGWLKVSIPTTFEEVQALAADPRSIGIVIGFLAGMFVIAAAIGLVWNRERFLRTALIFWVPYTILYTTVFTNSNGFFTGTIGSLGYWIVQQDVERGSQPWYYYLLVQIPIYEFLPALGFLLALVIGLRWKPKQGPVEDDPSSLPGPDSAEKNFPATFSLLVWWCVLSFATFSYAGERMPWLTYHITLPLIIISGWALGQVVENLDWAELRERRAGLTLASITVFLASCFGMALAWSGSTPPFQGRELSQLQATSQFLLPTGMALLSAFITVTLLRNWRLDHILRSLTLVFFSLLAVLTSRAAFRAAYINYDEATEFLVYAHASGSVKDVIAQAKEISERTTGGMGVALAYDASAPDTGVSWPLVWYLRDFTNQRAFDKPSRSLRESVVVIVDQKNFDKIETALGPGYYRTDYIRMWWPMQDYFNLISDRDPTLPFPENYPCTGVMSLIKLRKSKDYSRFCEGFTDPAIRAGIVQIWLNRDYTQYAQAKGRQDLTVATWQPSNGMRLYIRQDVASQIWNYGIAPAALAAVQDPTEGKFVPLASDLILTPIQPNSLPLDGPRSLAFANDGTLYVADSRNHRVVHMDLEGNLLAEWGTFADGNSTPIGNGTFNEPWGIAVGPDGSVYVTDTWNHRIEKFTPEGRFIKAWGFFGQGETPEAFYGPRGLAVDAEGRVYVADTGNKRIVVFAADGTPITQFGSLGVDAGQFDEPVGVAVDRAGMVYVVDTWNQRIQTFQRIETESGIEFIPSAQWDVYGWFGQSLENKPFIAVNEDRHIFVTDPEGYRVMEFDSSGAVVRTWGEFGDSPGNFGLASGITIDGQGAVWVTDSVNNRIMRFTLP
jgi:DNA-binding beta-propeller fold protein YncE/predicted membrane-bound mannosyltransferase